MDHQEISKVQPIWPRPDLVGELFQPRSDPLCELSVLGSSQRRRNSLHTQQLGLVVSLDTSNSRRSHEVQNPGGVRSFVHQVANGDQPISFHGTKALEEFLQLVFAPMDIADDECSSQATISRLLAEPKELVTNSRSGSGS